MLLVYQAALLDGLSLDAFTVEQDGLTSAEVDIGPGKAADPFIIDPIHQMPGLNT